MGKRAFQRLPIEVNENISSFLDTDKDFANFNAICHETHDAIQSHRCGAWRAQWKQEYDSPSRMTGLQVKVEYQKRRMLLYTKAFTMGGETAERNCIGILKRLVIESFAGSFKKQSNNMFRLERFLKESNILQTFNTCISIPEERCIPDLQALHACLAHWYFDNSGVVPRVSYNRFPSSQLVVYAKPVDFPIFLDKGDLTAASINMPTVLHMINFWRYYMKVSLCRTLDDDDKPKGWTRPVPNGHEGVRRLSRHWKGIYAYIPYPSDMEDLRTCVDKLPKAPGWRNVYVDELELQDGLEDIKFDFEEDHNNAIWPKAFEHHLQAMPSASFCAYNRDPIRAKKTKGQKAAKQKLPSSRPTSKAQKVPKRSHRAGSTTASRLTSDKVQNSSLRRESISLISPKLASPQKGKDYLVFGGSVESEDSSSIDHEICGILHNLPKQSGIPGFQRISFMKYANETPEQRDEVPLWASKDYGQQVDETYYCYQGVVLPGGHMIFGRWWAPSDDEDQYCIGPFMLWAVEE